MTNLTGDSLRLRLIRSINGFDIYGLCDNHVSRMDWIRVKFKKDTFYEKGFAHKENVCYHTTRGEEMAYGLKKKVDTQISSIAFHYDFKWYYVMYCPAQLFGYKGVCNEDLPIKTFLNLLKFDNEDLVYSSLKNLRNPYVYEVVWEGTNWKGFYHVIGSEQRLTRDFDKFPMNQYEIEDWKKTTKTTTTPNGEIIEKGLLKYIKNKFNSNDLICKD